MGIQDSGQKGTAPAKRGRTQWRRFALVAAPAMVTAGLVVGLTAEGALAASFAISGQNAKLSADKLEGTGFVQFGSIDVLSDGKPKAVLPSGFKTAKLYNLCQSVVFPSPFGPVTFKLNAGSGTTPVEATDLVADTGDLSGNITFTGYESGKDASKVDGPATGAAGAWGQQSKSILITDLKQTVWATTAGSFKLTGLKLGTSFGTSECF
jgi:hypothetical protein